MEGREFQFIFPNEESLELVMRRGPWAFNDRMLIIQRWVPQMPLLNFIPFWTQIRGILYQFLNRGVVEHIGRALGQVLDVDFDAEAVARIDFVRVLLHWDITQPLRFQRNFQFTVGVNTLLRFRYERLRGFCEVCGMLTHDSGACLIQNGGEEQDDVDDDEDQAPQRQNQGVISREINDDEDMEGMERVVVNARNQGADDNDANNGPTNSDDEVLPDIDPNHDALIQSEHASMFQEENAGEIIEPLSTPTTIGLVTPGSSQNSLPQSVFPLAIMDSECVVNAYPDSGNQPASQEVKNEEHDHSIVESATLTGRKRKFIESDEGTSQIGHQVEENVASLCDPDAANHVRGAVGPEPPLPL